MNDNLDILPTTVTLIEAFFYLRQITCIVSSRHENKGQPVSEFGLCVTCMYGPSHEERSIFLQVPAVTSSMHPWDLEDSLFLQTFVVSNAPSLLNCEHVFVHLSTHFFPKHIL